MSRLQKRLLSVTVFIVMAASFCFASAIFASADVSLLAWEIDGTDSNVTLDNSNSNYTAVAGIVDSPVKLRLSGAVNVNEGFSFRYLFVNANNIDVKEGVRDSGDNYIKTTIMSGDIGIQIVTYAKYIKAQNAPSQLAQMENDIFYIDPAVKNTSAKDNAAGIRYLETIETYVATDGEFHTIDLHKEDGLWFIATDGLSAMPIPEYNSMDLSNATVQFEVYSKAKAPAFRVYKPAAGALKQYIHHDMVQFGSDEITKLSDDTTRFRIRDKLAAKNPGSQIRYREQLISSKGYDVRQPINLEFSYDVSDASAVWYAVGLGRPNVYSTITKLKYNVFGYDGDPKSTGLSSYSDNIAAKNDAIMFQTTTGLAQPYYVGQNNRLSPYLTNSASKPYSGRGNMDLLTFVVKENGTDLYHNGELLFDNLVTKLSDFESNGYMAYPFFHFFEDNANPLKGNTIVIKGVNAARRTDDSELKVVGGSNTDLQIGLDNNDNGEITLHQYVGGTLTAVNSSLYSYDAQNKLLTVKYGFFEGKAYGLHNLYARNNSGSEEIVVRLSDPELVTQPPVPEQDVIYWKQEGGTEDLLVKVDVKNGIFMSFSGGGITRSQWESEQEGTIVTITIDKDFLNNKKDGTYTFTVRTGNIEQEEFTATFRIIVNQTGTEPDEDEDNGDNGDNGGDKPAGPACSSSAAAEAGAAAAAITLSGGLLFVVKRRKKSGS